MLCPSTMDARRAPAGSSAGLGRLLSDRLVGEHPDPDLAATLDVPGHRDSSGLDLARREPRRFESLNPEVAEVDGLATLRHSGHAPALLLAVLDLARHQHGQSASLRKCGTS